MIVIESCDLCPLHQYTNTIVHSENNLIEGRERIFFTGEAAGAEEERVGRPFVGRSGKLLRCCMYEAGIDSFYIANVCKCRPPQNREPTKEEANICGHFLRAEIAAIKPDLIVTLGKVAATYLIEDISYRRLRQMNCATFQHIKLKALFHPAYILRNRTLEGEYVKSLERCLRLAKDFSQNQRSTQ